MTNTIIRELELMPMPSEWVEEAPDYPLPVMDDDWADLLCKAETIATLIDKHLSFESKLQGQELTSVTLCTEQKVSLASDLSAAVA